MAIIGLGAFWLTTDQIVHVQFTWSSFFRNLPYLHYPTLPIIALGFAGIEVAAFYVQDTENPQRTFPRATFIQQPSYYHYLRAGGISDSDCHP